MLHEFVHSSEPASGIYEVQVFPGDDRLVTIGEDGRAVIWSALCGEELTSIDVGRHQVVRVLPAGEEIVTGVSLEMSDPAVIWTRETGADRLSLVQEYDEIHLLEVSPCGDWLVTAGFDGIFVWSVATGELLHMLSDPAGPYFQLAVSAGSRTVLAAADWLILVWNVSSGEADVRTPVDSRRASFAPLSEGDRYAYFTPFDAAVWDAASGESVVELDDEDGVLGCGADSVVVSACGSVVAGCFTGIGSQGGVFAWAAAWDLSTGNILARSAMREGEDVPRFCSVAVGPAGTMADELPLG